ncbi:MAG: phage holin family protein [Peptococcaceae bacterium]|nr:phage holin family protein [Peptococcaceae bacterium]
MKSLIVHLLSYSLGLYLTANLVQGLYFDSIATLILGAVVLSIVDAIIRPIVMILTLPINFLTIGLFTFVINGLMLKITSFIVPGMDVGGFWTATFAALVLTIISTIINWLISD